MPGAKCPPDIMCGHSGIKPHDPSHSEQSHSEQSIVYYYTTTAGIHSYESCETFLDYIFPASSLYQYPNQ